MKTLKMFEIELVATKDSYTRTLFVVADSMEEAMELAKKRQTDGFQYFVSVKFMRMVIAK